MSRNAITFCKQRSWALVFLLLLSHLGCYYSDLNGWNATHSSKNRDTPESGFLCFLQKRWIYRCVWRGKKNRRLSNGKFSCMECFKEAALFMCSVCVKLCGYNETTSVCPARYSTWHKKGLSKKNMFICDFGWTGLLNPPWNVGGSVFDQQNNHHVTIVCCPGCAAMEQATRWLVASQKVHIFHHRLNTLCRLQPAMH